MACVVKIGLDGYDVEMKGSQDSDLNSNHAFPHCVFLSLLFVQSANVTLLSSGNLLVFAREEFRFLSNNAPLSPFPMLLDSFVIPVSHFHCSVSLKKIKM